MKAGNTKLLTVLLNVSLALSLFLLSGFAISPPKQTVSHTVEVVVSKKTSKKLLDYSRDFGESIVHDHQVQSRNLLPQSLNYSTLCELNLKTCKSTQTLSYELTTILQVQLRIFPEELPIS